MFPRTAKRLGPIFAYGAEHPDEPGKDVAARFGVSTTSVGTKLRQHFGKSASERRTPPAIRCRICGEKDPAKFSKSSRYRTGLQDKCKACASDWQRRLWIAKRPQRLAEKYTAEELEAALRMKVPAVVEAQI